jgi:drug/metabolite transporter (DMT)-like permease
MSSGFLTHSASLYLSSVLLPVIALGLSTLFEDYQWSLRALFGFMLVLLGNYIVLSWARPQA